VKKKQRLLVGAAPLVVPEGELAWVPARVLAFEWRATEELVTLAVKTRASFAEAERSGSVKAFWTEPQPFDPAVDLVPCKPACDVLIRGSAVIPPRPSGYGEGLRAAEIAVGELVVARFLVDARRPGRVPLSPASVTAAGHWPVPEFHPRPLPDSSKLWVGEFDLEACQVVGTAQRVPVDEPVSRIVLAGLLEPDDPLTVELPILSPRLLVDPASANDEMVEAPLVLDTIVVDLDGLAVDLVWRGVVPATFARLDRVILGFGPDLPEDLDERWSRVLRELPRGRFGFAYSVSDVVQGVDPPELDEPTLEMLRLEAWEHPIGATPQISLETYARVTAELLERRQARELVLAKYGLDERSFAIEERAWTSELSHVPDEEPSLATRLGELIMKFQDELAAPGEQALGVAEYAALSAKMQRRDPMKVLGEAELSQAAFMRLERRVDAMVEADPNLADQLEREIERKLAELGPEEGLEDLPPEVSRELAAETAAEEGSGEDREETAP
jgi:hypothetical protein